MPSRVHYLLTNFSTIESQTEISIAKRSVISFEVSEILFILLFLTTDHKISAEIPCYKLIMLPLVYFGHTVAVYESA